MKYDQKILLKDLKNNLNISNYNFKKELTDYFSDLKKGKEELFCDINTLEHILKIIVQRNLNFNDNIFIAKYLYQKNVTYIPEENELKNYLNMFDALSKIISQNDLLADSHLESTVENINQIYSLFENKNLVTNLFISKEIKFNIRNDIQKLLVLKYYIVNSKVYYSDEYCYISNLHSFITKLNNINFDSNLLQNQNMELINSQINFDKKQAGIYDIDEESIKKSLSNLDLINKRIEELNNRLNNIDENSETIHEDIKNIKKDFLNDAKNLLENFKERKTFKITKKQNNNYNSIKVNKELIDISAYSQEKNLLVTTFSKNYEKIFDSEFLNSLTEDEKKFLDKLRLKNELPILKKALKHYYFNEINTEENWKIYKKINELFKEEIDAIPFKHMKNLLKAIDGKEYLINYIKEILKINPEFQFYYENDFSNQPWINLKTFELFDISTIAFADEKKQKLFSNFSLTQQLKKLKKILIVNPNFIDYTGNLHFLIIYNNVFTEEEIANFNKEQQLTFAEFTIFNKLDKLKEILEIKPDFVANDFTDYKYFYLSNFMDDIIDDSFYQVKLTFPIDKDKKTKFKKLILENNAEDLIYIYDSHKLYGMFLDLYVYSEFSDKINLDKQIEKEIILFNSLEINEKNQLLSYFYNENDLRNFKYGIRKNYANCFRKKIKKINLNKQKNLTLFKKN